MDRVATAAGAPPARPGVHLRQGGAEVAVFSRHGTHVWVCVADERGREQDRWLLGARDGDIFHGFVPGLREGTRYGLRADGPFAPEHGHRFDPAKLLVDPFATRLDRPFLHAAELGLPRAHAVDTFNLVPLAIVESTPTPAAQKRKPLFGGSLIYEVAVKAFSQLNPAVPAQARGTLAALAAPACIDHLKRLGVTHVELMPVAAWMDERHLPPLGLRNAWGYNPVTMMALDPRLAPGGLADLACAVDALHEADIAVLLDVVFNHTAESDADGTTVSLRGLDNAVYYRHASDDPGLLVNDTGCGNTLACDRLPVITLLMETMRHYVLHAGIDGYRFDLAPVMGRTSSGFHPEAPLLSAILQDPVLRNVTLIAEPWDLGPGGYQLGAFPSGFHEWNDRYRDDVRHFWRGDSGRIGNLATRLAGSADVFAPSLRRPSAGVNFIAAHDGFTLRDMVTYSEKHNLENGEENRDGTNDNLSWNNGEEGGTSPELEEHRRRDARALVATLLLSRGTPMITAGDEFGRTQNGNNNAYAQDNQTTWLDWERKDAEFEAFLIKLTALRKGAGLLASDRFLEGERPDRGLVADGVWLSVAGMPMTDADWADGDVLGLLLCDVDDPQDRVLIVLNRSATSQRFVMPASKIGRNWSCRLNSAEAWVSSKPVWRPEIDLSPRAVFLFEEKPS